MKKILLFSFIAISIISLSSCKDDDDNGGAGSDKMFMTMFRGEFNLGTGSQDPYLSKVIDLNDIQLYWYKVDGAAGYEIKWANQNKVANGPDAWEQAEADGNLLGHIIIDDPEQDQLLVKDLNYSYDYRFAIRTLSPKGEGYHSEWYGYGNGRQWAEWFGMTTGQRYEVPSVLQKSDITKTSFLIHLNRSIDGYTDDQMKGFREHFTDDGKNFKVDYLRVEASLTSPGAIVPEKFKKYQLTQEDWDRGYVEINGLNENSVYNVDVVDADIPVPVDATYNTISARTKGDAGPPILLTHKPEKYDTLVVNSAQKLYDISKYEASLLDNIINSYMNDMSMAENQVFYLEGGKNYYYRSNPNLYKGYTLETNPADLAAGKPRAKVFLNGLSTEGTAANTCNFMLGRQPESGENPTIPIDIDTICFREIDFDCPLAMNYGDGTATGNYFSNMYSNGMGINVTMYKIENCTFQRMVRGFFRVQGSNNKVVKNFIIEGCEFYNCGFYDNNGKGYAWLADDGAEQSNLFTNMIWRNNTFYDSPRVNLFSNNNKSNDWQKYGIVYHVELSNNTFINWSTRSSGLPIWNFRNFPAGSTFICKNNLFIMTKNDGDPRNMNFAGSDFRTINGTGDVTFDFANNWSTNTNLTAGQIFTANAFSAKSNSAGKFIGAGGIYPSGESELDVHVCNISPTELMNNPNPPHNADPNTATPLDHHVDNLNGLYYNDSPAVRGCEIFTKNVGAPKWRLGIGKK